MKLKKEGKNVYDMEKLDFGYGNIEKLQPEIGAFTQLK